MPPQSLSPFRRMFPALILPLLFAAGLPGPAAQGQAAAAPVAAPLFDPAAPDPDGRKQDVPQGRITHFIWKTSRVYPGTQHDCTVYVPTQYDPAHPACVLIFQDGLGFNAPTVLDNLIAKKEMPVTVAIGIAPGVAPPAGAHPNAALARFNRSVEYDTPDGTYARFLVDEILPEVGKTLNLSHDPNDRGLVGASSGGIAAFTAAWQRPDQFRRVYSVIGSFTDLCGGNTYPSQIRKTEPKPLRVFLEDNDHDLDIYSGSWPLANQEMAAALKYAGYDSHFVVGSGGHDGRPGSQLFPAVLRWLWRDYPAPIQAPTTASHQSVMQFLLPGEDWQSVAGVSAVRLAADRTGNVVFTSDPQITGLAAMPDGSRLLASPLGLIRLGRDGKTTRLTRTPAAGVTASADGAVYVTDGQGRVQKYPPRLTSSPPLPKREGKEVQTRRHERLFLTPPPPVSGGVASLSERGGFLALTPDRSLLVTGGGGPRKALLSWRIGADGTPGDAEPFFDLFTPYGQNGPQPVALAFDTQGWLYVLTPAGVQIADQAGRVNAILSLPANAGTPTGMTWGGLGRDTLYVACGGRLYKRRLRAQGVLPNDAPVTPPAPHL